MRLAVFGGTFDPPHNGHLALCLYARELLGLDRLLISVSNNPFKHAMTSADIHRRRMAALLSDEINATGECSAVSGWELSRQLPSYTIDLIHYVRELYPMAEITLLVGEDSYMDLPRWKSYEDIVMLCRIVVFQEKTGRRAIEGRERSCIRRVRQIH